MTLLELTLFFAAMTCLFFLAVWCCKVLAEQLSKQNTADIAKSILARKKEQWRSEQTEVTDGD